MNENGSNRQGSWRDHKEPENVSLCKDSGFTLSEAGSSFKVLVKSDMICLRF